MYSFGSKLISACRLDIPSKHFLLSFGRKWKQKQKEETLKRFRFEELQNRITLESIQERLSNLDN